jgi:3-hydroxy acid dehydrogenase/malonic semialdehyde reductase
LTNYRGFMSGVEQPPDVPPDVVRDVYATNVLGVINMTQAVLPIMKKRGKGDVIFIGSLAGRDAYVGGTVESIARLNEGLLIEIDLLLE